MRNLGSRLQTGVSVASCGSGATTASVNHEPDIENDLDCDSRNVVRVRIPSNHVFDFSDVTFARPSLVKNSPHQKLVFHHDH